MASDGRMAHQWYYPVVADSDSRYQELCDLLRGMGGAAVAFSGGADSSLLLAAACDALGDRALAVIGRSPIFPAREIEEAARLAQRIGARCEVVETGEMLDPEFRANLSDRCFRCKTALLAAVRELAERQGLAHVVEGSNADDRGDFRPGREAVRRLGVRSPLSDLGFTKEEIRSISRGIGLSTWNKPAAACLCSRIPYGEELTAERLRRVERAEEALRGLGVRQLRVRDHGTVARLEVEPGEMARLAGPEMRDQIVAALKAAGYTYVCLDLQGYRPGAMNETLDPEELAAWREPRG